jgi:putative membrane protein
MHAGRHYTFREVASWTRRETALFFLLAAIPVGLVEFSGRVPLSLPWAPVALIGTAVAFVTGFKNNAAYNRLWEARQVWGGIINTSRIFAVQVFDSVPEAASRQRILYRHFAWLTALRFQLRERRAWETMKRPYNVEFQRRYRVPEWESTLDAEIAPLLSPVDAAYLLALKNRATHLIHLQSQDLRQLAHGDTNAELRHLEIQRSLAALLDAQGRCERIKNFPYPRQYATLNHIFVWILILLLPWTLMPEFQKLGPGWIWLTVPFCALLSWIFHTLEKIGDSSENPFEGSPNDAPISAMSRAIEIDLREMLGESSVPAPHQPTNNILM